MALILTIGIAMGIGSNPVAMAATDIRIEIDGKPIQMEVKPQVNNDRVMVPFRAIFESLGLKVDWNTGLKTATAYNDTMNVSIKLGAGFGSINGELQSLDAKASIVDGRMLVPLRFVSEAFGNDVQWNASTRTVSIKSGFEPYAYTSDLPVVGNFDKLKLILEYGSKYTRSDYRYLDIPVADMMESSASGSNAPAPAVTSQAPSKSSGTTDSSSSHSTTNVQVEGVDEADIVKTNGKEIYQLRQNDIKITSVSSTGTLKALSTIALDSSLYGNDMYLHDNLLVVIGTRQSYMPYPIADEMPLQPGQVYAPTIMPPTEPSTKILFYDISNPAKPMLVREFDTDGSYSTSRMTNGNLYLIATKWLNIYNLDEKSSIPEFSDKHSGKSANLSTLGFDQIRYFPDTVETSLMITLAFDLSNLDQPADKQAYLGGGGNVFADQKDLVVAMDNYNYDVAGYEKVGYPVFTHTTELFRFALDKATIRFKAKGSVPGSILNQFSMDSNGSHFRIATTTGETWNDTSRNNLYVLDDKMGTVGRLEGLAPTERIYSVRFLGDRAYMVTFRQVDPFYVIDLKDPKAPKVLGYLKIPGFSDYLHPYDANTIIGFGKDTIETANGPIQGGIKIAMFDVTNVEKPVEKSKIVLGTAGSWSDVLTNHKALLFSKEKSLFAIPVSLYDGNPREAKFSFQGAYVYSIDPAKGFVLKGKSSHLTAAEVYDSVLKWYDYKKNVSRIIWAGDHLFTLSEYGIKGHDLSTMKEQQFFKHP